MYIPANKNDKAIKAQYIKQFIPGTWLYSIICLANSRNQYIGFNFIKNWNFAGIIATSYIIGVRYVHSVINTP